MRIGYDKAVITTLPSCLRGEEDDSRGGEDVDSLLDGEFEYSDEEPWLVCVACSAKITKPSLVSAIGAFDAYRVVFNPAGLIYQLVTVLDAKSLNLVGPSSGEFSWYPGYAWRSCECAGCRQHMGWFFETVKSDSVRTFFGLIRKHLSAQNEGEG